MTAVKLKTNPTQKTFPEITLDENVFTIIYNRNDPYCYVYTVNNEKLLATLKSKKVWYSRSPFIRCLKANMHFGNPSILMEMDVNPYIPIAEHPDYRWSMKTIEYEDDLAGIDHHQYTKDPDEELCSLEV